MKVSYVNKRVEKAMQDDALAKGVGLQLARQIRKRLNQMKAALSLAEYLSNGLGKPHSLSADKKGSYAASISGNYRIVFRAVLNPEDDERFELNQVTEISIIGVGDYHGGKDNWIIP